MLLFILQLECGIDAATFVQETSPVKANFNRSSNKLDHFSTFIKNGLAFSRDRYKLGLPPHVDLAYVADVEPDEVEGGVKDQIGDQLLHQDPVLHAPLWKNIR